MQSAEPQVTQLLGRWKSGDADALDQVTAMLQGELRRLAASYLRREKPGHTLQPTALVNEAYLRFASLGDFDWKDRSHFLGIAARLMRQILVQHARGKHAAKRGGEAGRLPLNEALAVSEESSSELLALNEAMDELAKVDPEKARIVEMRYFAGLSSEEIAEAVGVSRHTVDRHLKVAQAWLHRYLSQSAQ